MAPTCARQIDPATAISCGDGNGLRLGCQWVVEVWPMKLKRLSGSGSGFTGLQVAALDAETSETVWKACRQSQNS